MTRTSEENGHDDRRDRDFLIYHFGDSKPGNIQIVMKYTAYDEFSLRDFDYVEMILGDYSSPGQVFGYSEDYVIQRTGCKTLEEFNSKHPEYLI